MESLLHLAAQLVDFFLQRALGQLEPLHLDPRLRQQEVFEDACSARPVRRLGVHHHADELLERRAVAGFVEARQLALPDVGPLWPVAGQAFAW